MASVLDASALLAFWLSESGGTVVRTVIEAEGGLISSVNLAEALAKLDDLQTGFAARLKVAPNRSAIRGCPDHRWRKGPPGRRRRRAVHHWRRAGLGHPECVPKGQGLSLGDRACLALGKRMGLQVLTADQIWGTLAQTLGVTVRIIR